MKSCNRFGLPRSDGWGFVGKVSVALALCLGWAAFAGASLPMRCERNSVSTPDGLAIDSLGSAEEFGWRRYGFVDDADLFKTNERWRVSFRCKVEGRGKGASLLVLVRPLSVSGAERDALSLRVDPTAGEWKAFSVPFNTCGATDYRLQFHGWNRIRAEIADLRVERLAPYSFKPALADAPRSACRLGPLPAGAKEFDVDLPHEGAGVVLDAAVFGVSETNADNTAAMRAAFAAAKERKACRLELRKGTYRFLSDAPVELDGYRDLTFDGNGSTFVSWRREGAFVRLKGCERVCLKNFCLDWDWVRDPLASLVRISRTDAKSFDLEFVEYRDFPNKRTMLSILSAFDPKTRSVGIEDGITRAIDMNAAPRDRVKRSWMNGNTVRVEAPPQGFRVGQLYRLQHYYYHMNGIAMEANAHVRLENVTILSTPGHAFLMSGRQHHTLFDHVNIVAPKDDPRRVITCTADHLHVAQSQGFIKLQDCEFSLGADDIMNMHDNTAFARRTGAHTVRALNAWVMTTARKGDRIELRHGDYSSTGFFGTFVSAKKVEGTISDFDVTFEEELPPEAPGAAKEGFILFNWSYDTHNVIVRGCNFHDNRARALLILARDVTVENNVFRHHEMGAIKIETGYTRTLWSEGYGVSNVVIRGNLFDNVNPSGSYAGHRERTIYTGIYLKTDPSADTTDYPIIRDLLIERNRFKDNFGVTAYLSSVWNVVVRDNEIEDPTPRRNEREYRSQFFLTHARDVKIIDNVYHASPAVKKPGVCWDPDNCDGIVAEGNRCR